MYTAKKIETFRPAYRCGKSTFSENPENAIRTSFRGDSVRWLKWIFFCLLSAFNLALPSITLAANSLSQFGITWTFDKELSTDGTGDTYQYGQFANGDFWVVGPVTIIGIAPPSFIGDGVQTQGGDSWIVEDGRIVNGAMRSPDPIVYQQGYDSASTSIIYNESLNVARKDGAPVSSGEPLELPANNSLISSISLDHSHSEYVPHQGYMLKTAAVLTILDSAPAVGSFRPPYSGTDKLIKFNENQLNYNLLGTLDKKSFADSSDLNMNDWTDPRDSSAERMINRPWIDHVSGVWGEVVAPIENMERYPGYRTRQLQVIAMLLNVDWTGSPGFVSNDQYKRNLLVSTVQHGIDTYGIYQAGAKQHWIPDGGHGIGRKWPILFAGVMLEGIGAHSDAAAMANIGFNDHDDPIFSEDGQSFYVNQRNLDIQNAIYAGQYPERKWADSDNVCDGTSNPNHCRVNSGPDPRDQFHIPYTQEDVDNKLPEWGIRYRSKVGPYAYPFSDGYLTAYMCNRAWSTEYREGTNNANFPGLVLSMHIMDLKSRWNHDSFFDYMDRYIPIEKEIRDRIVAAGGGSGYGSCIWNSSIGACEPGIVFNIPGTPATDVHGNPVHEVFKRHYVCSSAFVEKMWDTYRADYGPVWTLDPNSQSYSITASAGSGGQISPSGTTQVVSGGSQTYTITQNAGYHISDVLVDGSSVGAVTSYSFTNVTANHTITATFAINTYTITASTGSGGQISPSGITQVASGGSQTYTITQNAGYHISDVLVDGSSVGDVTSYSFTNVTTNHTIAATFAIDTHTITASASSGGQISPSGTTQVVSGGSQTYTITQNAGYHISDVLVDGSSVGDVTSYNFTNVTANHNISATFAINTYSIVASAGNDGQISPSGTTQVASGGSQTYTITQNAGYHISDVVVDGSSVGAVTSYSFTNVTANHTIAATFDEQDVTAPTATNLSPQADSIQAPLNSLVILDVTDSGDGVEASSVEIRVNDNLVYAGNTETYNTADGVCRRAGTQEHYKFAYQAAELFDFDQNMTVTVDAKDLADNPNPITYSYSFTTEMRSFGENKKVALDNLKKGRPATVGDSEGDIWAVWHAGPIGGSRDIYIGKLVAGAEYFGDSINITDNSSDQCNPVIAIGSDDKIYLAWQDNRRGNWDIYVSTSTDGLKWSAETRVTDSNDNQLNPAIVVDSDSPNKAYIVWEDDRNGNKDIYVARSSDGFATKIVTPITTDSFDQFEPAIAVDYDNTIYVVWTDTRNGSKNDIYGAASNDGPWTNIPVVAEEDSQSSPAIATEAVGSILHLVWVDDRTVDRDDDIFYDKTSGGLSPLTGSSIIDDSNGADQISPVIITTGSTGNDLKVFACWRDERNLDSDLYSVELSSGNRTNVFVGDDGTHTDQSEPAMGINGYDYPYIVWTNERTDICYAGSTFFEPDALVSKDITVSTGATVGVTPDNIDSLDDVSVVIPKDAFWSDIKVTISRIHNLPAIVPGEFQIGYEIGPSGVEFSEPVTVIIPYEANGSDNVSYTAYWYNSQTGALSQQGITSVETIIISPSLHALRFKTTHFSLFIIGGGGGGGFLGGLLGGGGGGCSMSAAGEGTIAEFFLPYAGLTVAMVILKLRDTRKRKAHNITKS